MFSINCLSDNIGVSCYYLPIAILRQLWTSYAPDDKIKPMLYLCVRIANDTILIGSEGMKSGIRAAVWVPLDIFLINISIIVSYLLRYDGNVELRAWEFYRNSVVIITITKIAIFYYFDLYKSLWKYASIDELISVVVATGISNALVISYIFLSQNFAPRSIYIIAWIMDIVLIGGSRFMYRACRRLFGGDITRNTDAKRVMIVGAGDAGAIIIREFKRHPELKSAPVAVVDDDIKKHGRRINGVPVVGGRCDIQEIVRRKRIDEIIIAIPSASRNQISQIIGECKKTRCKLKILPGVYELIGGKVEVQKIRNVEIEDLLGRDPVKVNFDEISEYMHDEVVLVTGGGGSIGSELCRQIANFNPQKLLIFDIYENGAYDVQNELEKLYPSLQLEVLIGSIRDKDRIDEIFEEYHPSIVFHAAAHKHVPLMEANPWEAVKNNVFGTMNVAEAADKHSAKKFILISTDKAVNPTNIMGATKRLAEMIIEAMDKHSKNTVFAAVRFGNVLGSSGSVIPLFKKQIAEGGPVTVTHPEITRYFMTIPEAVQLVIQAGAMAKSGEIFVLDMGEPVKIIDLANDLIKLSGFEPGIDIEVEITGLRPGEKLYEELLMAEEGLKTTRHEKIFVSNLTDVDYKRLKKELAQLQKMLENKKDDWVSTIRKIVPTYTHVANI